MAVIQRNPVKTKESFHREREFGLIVGGVLVLLSSWWLYRGKRGSVVQVTLPASVPLVVFGFFFPRALVWPDVVERRRRKMTAEEQALWGIEKLNVQRSEIPAVTHVDYSARIQTVRRETNPLYWEIIDAFRVRTGPVIVNTSFNVRGEPIVCTPEDSYRCFMRTEMDFLVLETCLLDKREQPKFEETADWRSQFKLD